VDRNEKLLEVGVALSSELSLPALLQRITELAAEVTDARFAALGVIGPDGDLVDFLTHGVTPEERRAIGPLPRGRGILGVLIHDARVLRLHDIADDPRSVGFPPNHPRMRAFLGAPVRARGQVFGNLYLTEKEGGGDFTADDEAALTVLATQAGVAVANARLYEEVQLRARWLDAVREISTAILSGESSDGVLRLVAQRARVLMGADLASIVTPEEEAGSLIVAVADGAHAAELEGMHVPANHSLSGEVMRTGRPLLLEDASADARSYQPMVSVGRLGPSLWMPLAVGGLPLGTIAVANLAGGRHFREEHVRLLGTFADQAALGFEYTRVQRELGRLALVEDRERIAKELHDGVIQSLFAVGLNLQATAALGGDRRVGERIQDAVNQIDRVIGDLRNYIFALRPAVLANGLLGDALRQLAHELQTRSGVTTIVDVDPALERTLGEHATHIVQLTREALSNVGRHAEATTCRVSLRRHEEDVLLEIDDDGRGFDVSAAVASGMGLSNVHNRVASMGGQIDIESVPGEGTTVRIRLPLSAARGVAGS
jgi:signal transduction histidine kinase